MSEHSTEEPSAAAGGTCELLSSLCTLKRGSFADAQAVKWQPEAAPQLCHGPSTSSCRAKPVTFHTVTRKHQEIAFTLL